jgi:[acyl-carrier-protein] S-malonyltransferase/trans-AT polyketide synthase/acyltransferase/oxidoreductase domain-containing protein
MNEAVLWIKMPRHKIAKAIFFSFLFLLMKSDIPIIKLTVANIKISILDYGFIPFSLLSLKSSMPSPQVRNPLRSGKRFIHFLLMLVSFCYFSLLYLFVFILYFLYCFSYFTSAHYLLCHPRLTNIPEFIMVPQNSIAVVFPGQGSQRPGMGKDFFENIPVSRQTFEEASDALGWDVATLCFSVDDRLNLTEFTQPCILATEIAMYRGLQALYPFSPSFFGGHSLGEFSALVAAEVFPFQDTLRIVHERGRLMQNAVPVGVGGMAAVILNDLDVQHIRRLLADLPVDVANENSLNQVVISGDAASLPIAEKRLSEQFTDPSFRVVALRVSAPFHSRFMQPIEEPFGQVLESSSSSWKSPNAVKVTSNYSGTYHSSATGAILQSLVRQLSHTVRWIDNMRALSSSAKSVFEVGPGRPLRDFFKTVGVTCSSITTFSAAERLFRDAK